MNQLIREDNTALGKTYVYTYDNAGNILTKSTYGNYFSKNLTKHKVVPLGFNDFLHSTGRKAFSYISAVLAWSFTGFAVVCSDPVAVAKIRGYSLK